MKLTTAALITALAIMTPASVFAQTGAIPESLIDALSIAPPVTSAEPSTVTTAATKPSDSSDATQQKSEKKGKSSADSGVFPTDNAVIGSTVTSNDIDSLPMDGRDVLSLIGSGR